MTDTEQKKQRIIRSKPDTEYFSLPNAAAQNIDIPYDALGVLTYLLSKPVDWETTVFDLRRRGDGKGKVYRILKDLEQAGYMSKPTKFQDKKTKRWVWTPRKVADTPKFSNPCPTNPDTAHPDTANKEIKEQRTDEKEQITKRDSPQQKSAAEQSDDCMDDGNPYVMLCSGCGGYKQHSGLDTGVCDDCMDDGITPEQLAANIKASNEYMDSLSPEMYRWSVKQERDTELESLPAYQYDGLLYAGHHCPMCARVLSTSELWYLPLLQRCICESCFFRLVEAETTGRTPDYRKARGVLVPPGAAIDTDSSLTHDEVQHAAELAAEQQADLQRWQQASDNGQIRERAEGDGCDKCGGKVNAGSDAKCTVCGHFNSSCVIDSTMQKSATEQLAAEQCSGPECFDSQQLAPAEKIGALCEVVEDKPKAKKPRKVSADTLMKNALVAAMGFRREDVTCWGEYQAASKKLRAAKFPVEDIPVLYTFSRTLAKHCNYKFKSPMQLARDLPDFRKAQRKIKQHTKTEVADLGPMNPSAGVIRQAESE